MSLSPSTWWKRQDHLGTGRWAGQPCGWPPALAPGTEYSLLITHIPEQAPEYIVFPPVTQSSQSDLLSRAGHKIIICVHPSPASVHPSPASVHSSPPSVHPSPASVHPSPASVHPSPASVHPSPVQCTPFSPPVYTLHPPSVHPSPVQCTPFSRQCTVGAHEYD